MSTVINRATLQVFESVNTPDYSRVEYLVLERSRDNSDYEALLMVPKAYWKIEDDRLAEMTTAEKVTVDTVELTQHKRDRRKLLERAANAFLQDNYTMEQQQTISYLMDEAEREGRVNRFNYFNQVGEWAKTLLGHFYTQEFFINSARSKAEVDAVSFDFNSFKASDPDVRIGVGSQIVD